MKCSIPLTSYGYYVVAQLEDAPCFKHIRLIDTSREALLEMEMLMFKTTPGCKNYFCSIFLRLGTRMAIRIQLSVKAV